MACGKCQSAASVNTAAVTPIRLAASREWRGCEGMHELREEKVPVPVCVREHCCCHTHQAGGTKVAHLGEHV